MESSNEILLGTIGYHLLANHSIGPLLIDGISKLDWTQDNIDVEEMNWGPIAIVQKFQTGDVNYKRVVFLTALERIHRKTGDLTIYKCCLLYTSPSPRDKRQSRMPSSA